TMTNQIAIKCYTQPGQEVICEQTSHVYIYEGGGIAFNSGCQVKPLIGERGRITAGQVESAVNPDDIHKPVSSLVCIENTANRGGGSLYDASEILLIRNACDKNDLSLHLDGARLWNAMEATNEGPEWYGKVFDSISICMSKGMGAPVGSVLIGAKDFITRARRIRKVMGGGMRQAGYLAAAALYALENNRPLLKRDHIHAKRIAAALLEKPFIGKMLPVETNIIIFEVKGNYTPASFSAFLKENNIHCIAISPFEVRMVTHLDVTEPMVDSLVELIGRM
ncbi:MAG: threonine aldolase, partial [Chitinophagaceae bacterium]